MGSATHAIGVYCSTHTMLLSSFDFGGEGLVGAECSTCHRCVMQHAYNVA